MDTTQKITACAFLHKDGKFFTAKRADTKTFLPGKFEMPGGHIEHGETMEEGLKREFQEEFGVDITVGHPFYAFTYMNGDAHVVEVNYLAELADENQTITLNPEDHSEYRWLTKEEFERMWDPKDAEYKAVERGFSLLENGHS
jgi:8-oxo-dGTP diphosphatase